MVDESYIPVGGESVGAPVIISLFGHSTIAGYLSVDTRFGEPMLRVDVPATKTQPAFTRHYGVKAVYSIDWISEELMLAVANQAQVRPISVYMPELATDQRLLSEEIRSARNYTDDEDTD